MDILSPAERQLLEMLAQAGNGFAFDHTSRTAHAIFVHPDRASWFQSSESPNLLPTKRQISDSVKMRMRAWFACFRRRRRAVTDTSSCHVKVSSGLAISSRSRSVVKNTASPNLPADRSLPSPRVSAWKKALKRQPRQATYTEPCFLSDVAPTQRLS